MRRSTVMLAGLAAVCLLIPAARGQDPEKTAAQWQEELRSAKDAPTRRNAAFALGKLGSRGKTDPKGARNAVPDLMRCAQSDEDAGVRETAVWSLGQIEPKGGARPAVVALLCQLATAKVDERIRRSAVVALGNCGPDTEAIRTVLDQALDDPSAAVRQNAVWALGEICLDTDNVPVPSLRKALLDRKDDKLVKRDAALALHNIVGKAKQSGQARFDKVKSQARDMMDDLLLCAVHDYVELRKAVCGTLADLVTPQDITSLPTLVQACKDEDLEVRFNGALALTTIGGEGWKAALPVLQEGLHKGDTTMRREAAKRFRSVAAQFKKDYLDDLLQALAKDPDPMVRAYTAVTFETWGDRSDAVVPALVARLIDRKESPAVREAAAVSLNSIGTRPQTAAAIPSLAAILGDPKQPPRVREYIIWVFRSVRGDLAKHPQAYSAMKQALSEPMLQNGTNKMLRYNCACELGACLGPDVPAEVLPVILEYLRDTTIKIVTARDTHLGSVKEGRDDKATVQLKLSADGRTWPIWALETIGYDRVKEQPEIIDQLKVLRTIDDRTVRNLALKLLEKWEVK